MTPIRLNPFFLDGAAGRLFFLLRATDNAQRCVLFVPPFAEEMNKCRKQVTETAKVLVERGYAVLVFDLFGTGDSEGEFGQARWEIWKSDVNTALNWIDAAGLSIHAVVATRLGCVLAAEALQESQATVNRSVFWQPTPKGRQFMTQFLRLRVAASMMSDSGKETVDSLREKLSQGAAISVAGYELAPDLVRSIDATDLAANLSKNLGALRILEVSATASGELSAAGKQFAGACDEREINVMGKRLNGEPFWTATEIVVNRPLCDMTVDYIEDDTA